jgi:hypothetical protein
LNEHAQLAWKEIASEVPWLNSSHRGHLAIAANIRGRMMKGDDVGVQAMNLLRQCYGQMGATPADSSKIPPPAEEPETTIWTSFSADKIRISKMQLSSSADYVAAADEYARVTELALLAGEDPIALGEAMTQAGLCLLSRVIGAPDTIAYALYALSALTSGEARNGH